LIDPPDDSKGERKSGEVAFKAVRDGVGGECDGRAKKKNPAQLGYLLLDTGPFRREDSLEEGDFRGGRPRHYNQNFVKLQRNLNKIRRGKLMKESSKGIGRKGFPVESNVLSENLFICTEMEELI